MLTSTVSVPQLITEKEDYFITGGMFYFKNKT
jgi:hypothetical protein